MPRGCVPKSCPPTGVSAPIVGTTSLNNLNDLLGNSPFTATVAALVTNGNLSNLGAVDVKLTDEEIKELEAPYIPQAPYGHT